MHQPVALSSAHRWSAIALLIGAGMVAAFQIGKAAISAPLLRQDLGLDLATAALVISLIAALGAVAGLPVGLFTASFRPRRLIVGGLLTMGAGSLLGAIAPTASLLLVTRALEGCGFIVVAIATPRLIRTVAAPQDRDLALACWGAYLPAGAALMMFAGPWLLAFGWRQLWLANGVVAGLYAGLVWLMVPAADEEKRAVPSGLLADLADVLRRPAPILVAVTFGLYTFHYSAISGLLPSLLVDRLGLSVAQAGIVSAATVLANAAGNLVAGVLLRFGIPFWANAASAFACLGLCALGIFADSSPIAVVATLAGASLAVTGLVPASTYAASVHTAPPALLGIALGLILQASNIGHFAGPATLGWWAGAFGWSSAPALFGVVAIAGMLTSLALRKRLHGGERDHVVTVARGD